MNRNIIDGMKKEGKGFKILMIFAYILSLLMFLSTYLINNEKYSDKDIIIIVVFCFFFGTFGLYGWLYSIKYKLKITEEKIMLKTLFRTVEVNIKDITNYTCHRYRKSVFYQFNLFVKEKRILVATRYKEEFENILKYNNVEPMIKNSKSV